MPVIEFVDQSKVNIGRYPADWLYGYLKRYLPGERRFMLFVACIVFCLLFVECLFFVVNKILISFDSVKKKTHSASECF
jgi:hypothetical protein